VSREEPLAAAKSGCYFPAMSTLTEIEEALPRLSAEELMRVEAALRRLQRQRTGQVPHIAAVEQRNGFDVLPQRGTAMATVEDVRRLCAEEGI
jgi:hypothetical protein